MTQPKAALKTTTGRAEPRRTLDVEFINPFLVATIKVFETQASTRSKAGKAYKKEEARRSKYDISGVIGIVSDQFTGSVAIGFPAATFLKIMSKMLGEEVTSITKEIEDGAGEITNMIFGQAKVSLNQNGHSIKTALPSVVAGPDHSLGSGSSGPCVVIPFESDAGEFFVEIQLSA